MKISKFRLSLAVALATAVTWLGCALFVWAVPKIAARITGDMLHMETFGADWKLDIAGVLVGGLAWMFMAFALVWLSITIYQLMVDDRR